MFLRLYAYKSQMLSFRQATISDAEDLRNLDHTIVNIKVCKYQESTRAIVLKIVAEGKIEI